jgi:cytoskeleton-associated protein 5
VKHELTSKMRDAQKKEVEEAMDAMDRSMATQPTRYLRRDAAKAAAAPAAAPAASSSASAAPRAAPGVAVGGDNWDLFTPEDILSKLAKKEAGKPSFWDGVASEKWKERAEAYATLTQLAGAPRLQPGDYGEVARLIKKTVASDSNAAVISAAVDAAEALARGLRRDFRSEARMLTPHLLDKLKDKALNIIRAIGGALTAFHAHVFTLAGAPCA